MKIRLDSNIMREPQRLDDMGNLASGIARDLILWAAWNGTTDVILHLPQFCEMFGYQRKHLLRPLDEKKLDKIKKLYKAEHVPNLNNSLGWTLMNMSRWNLVFYVNSKGRIPLNASKKSLKCRYQSLRIISQLQPESCIEKFKTGTVARMVFDQQLIYNCRDFYQEVTLEDYLSLCTDKGQADDKARRLYLHMAWLRQLWDGVAIPKGYDPSKPDYHELLRVAGLDYSLDKKNATLLRGLLNRVGALASVQLEATVTHDAALNTYSVKLKKRGGRLRPKRKKYTKRPPAAT